MARVSTIGPLVPIQGQGGTTMTPGQTPEPLRAADDSLMSTATAPAAVRPRPGGREPYAVVGRPRNEGHGKRLTAAFEALEVFPALAESRNRLLELISEESPSTGEVVRAIESDVALVISVLRLANGLDSPRRGQVESIVGPVEVLSPEAVQRLAAHAGGPAAPRAARAGRRPRAGRRRPRTPLEPAEGGRIGDRAPPRRGCAGRQRVR